MKNELQTLRLFSPLFSHIYRRNEWGDYENEPEDLTASEILEYEEIPVPPLLMGEVFILVCRPVKVLIDFNRDYNRQGLSANFYGYLHNRSSIQIFWSEWGRRGTATRVYERKNARLKFMKSQSGMDIVGQ